MIGDDDLGDLFQHSGDELEAGNPEDAENERDDDAANNGETNNEEADGGPTTTKSKRKVIRNPQLKLDPVRLCGNRGIPILPDTFKNIVLHGKGKEREDINKIIKVLEHWGHRLYPKLRFDDLLEKIETLGKKKAVQVCVKKIRLDMPLNFDEEIAGPNENIDQDIPTNPDDLFDTLHEEPNIQEQENLFPNSPVFDEPPDIF